MKINFLFVKTDEYFNLDNNIIENFIFTKFLLSSEFDFENLLNLHILIQGSMDSKMESYKYKKDKV